MTMRVEPHADGFAASSGGELICALIRAILFEKLVLC